MDSQVIAAMARWPDVPAVYGWLSLSESGQWRLHPAGDALRQPRSPGEAITSPQILAFIGRNYDADDAGQWYFQNGPQRVYVRLDAAPFIAHSVLDGATGKLTLRTHTGLDIRRLDAFALDEHGRLYAATDRGPVLVAGRDLPALFDALSVVGPGAEGGEAPDMEDAILRCSVPGASVALASTGIIGIASQPLSLTHCPEASLEETLGFRRHPVPPQAA